MTHFGFDPSNFEALAFFNIVILYYIIPITTISKYQLANFIL